MSPAEDKTADANIAGDTTAGEASLGRATNSGESAASDNPQGPQPETAKSQRQASTISRSQKPTLLFFADDWGRHPSSSQHLIRQLLPEIPVIWVNTIGTRRPRLDWDTLQRAAGKLRQWALPAGSARQQVLPENLTVLNPKMWPYLRRGHDRWLNRLLLTSTLKPIVEKAPGPVIGITTLPLIGELIGLLPVARWVYYCVDDFGVWPGLDGRTLQEMEVTLIERADRLIAVSHTLQEKLQASGKPVELLSHGVDLQHWQGTEQLLPGLEEIEPPIVLFWGLIDRRMDVALVRSLSERLQQENRGSIVLMGPSDNPDPALLQMPRVILTGPQPYDHLPGWAQQAAVLVMPYDDLPVTRAMQPLKLKEYLATGRPVVARNLPAVIPWGDCLDAVTTPEQFTNAVILRIEAGVPPAQQQARVRLQQEGWPAKAAQFAEHIGLTL